VIALTDREIEIAQLVAQGWSNVEIAERLGLSQNTIRDEATWQQLMDLSLAIGPVSQRPYFLVGLEGLLATPTSALIIGILSLLTLLAMPIPQ